MPQARLIQPLRGRTTTNPGLLPALLLANNGAGGTNGVAPTAGNSGGVSGSAWNSVVVGTGASVTYDNTQAIYTSLSYKVSTTATSTTAYVAWTNSPGIQRKLWFRAYCYLTANPGANFRIVSAFQGGTICAAVQITTTGNLRSQNAAAGTIQTSTATVPLNQWFRIEGFFTCDPSLGQVEMRLFKNPAGQVPDEVDTSTATQNTLGAATAIRFGVGTAVANVGPFWIGWLGVSNTALLGPASLTAAPSAGQPTRIRVPQNAPRGRTTALPGAPVTNPVPGPVFRQATRPAQARYPQLHPRAGRTAALPGAPVVNPRPGPPFRQAVWPARAPVPQTFSAGQHTANRGAPVSNPSPGPVFRQAVRPSRAPVPQTWSKGRTYPGTGAPLNNPIPGPAFYQATHPAQARYPQLHPRAGRTAALPGAPVVNPVPGPVFYQATAPARKRNVHPPRGRTTGNRGAPVVPHPPAAQPPAILHITPAGAQAATVIVTPAGAQTAALTVTPTGPLTATLTITTSEPQTTELPPPAPFTVPPPGPAQLTTAN